MLLFLPLFGPKKSSVATYITYWGLKLKDYWFLYYNKFNISSPRQSSFAGSHCLGELAFSTNLTIIRFQLTSVTSRLTIYVLFTFWIFFFFFGNTLLSVLLNYNTLSETIFSSSFTTIKQHVIYTSFTSTMWLSRIIFIYILTLTMFSLSLLLNLRYTFTYNYFYVVYLLDFLTLLLIALFCVL